MPAKPTATAISTVLAALNDHQQNQLALVAHWTPEYRDKVVSYYRLDRRSVNALKRHGLVTPHERPVEGCKLTPLGVEVAAVVAQMRRKR